MGCLIKVEAEGKCKGGDKLVFQNLQIYAEKSKPDSGRKETTGTKRRKTMLVLLMIKSLLSPSFSSNFCYFTAKIGDFLQISLNCAYWLRLLSSISFC